MGWNMWETLIIGQVAPHSYGKLVESSIFNIIKFGDYICISYSIAVHTYRTVLYYFMFIIMNRLLQLLGLYAHYEEEARVPL